MSGKKKKKNVNKVPWILKDFNLVPRNKKNRIILFLSFNIVLISLLPLSAIFINYPYGYVLWILYFCIGFLFNKIAFNVHMERFPLNQYKEYSFNPKNDELALSLDNKCYIIELEKESHVYKVRLREKVLIFNMKGCLCPVTIIKAYLIRQFIIVYINKYKLVSDTMCKNVYITKLFTEYINIKLIYINRRKIKSWFLLKNGKTKMNLVMKIINGTGYVTWGRGVGLPRHVKIEEQEFVERKNKYN